MWTWVTPKIKRKIFKKINWIKTMFKWKGKQKKVQKMRKSKKKGEHVEHWMKVKIKIATMKKWLSLNTTIRKPSNTLDRVSFKDGMVLTMN